jgi:pyruvate-formate lyase-activating enzyme
VSDLALPYVMPPIADAELAAVKYRNFLKSLRNRRQRQTLVDSDPFDLTIDLTSACQLKCPYCSTGNGTIQRQKAIMKDEMYHKLLKDVGDACFIIWYFSNGEPLLHKRFGELVATTRHQEIFSVISTNLSLRLSDEFLRSLITSGLGIISVSIDGATAETYRQYRRGGEFNLVMDNVRRLVRLKAELGQTYPLIEWRFLRFRHNEHDEAAARALAAQLGVDLLEFWPGSAPPEGSPAVDGVLEASLPLQGPPVTGPGLDLLAMRQANQCVLAKLVPGIEIGGNAEMSSFTPKCDWLYFSGMLHPSGRVGSCCVSNDEPDDFVESVADFASYNELFNSPKYTASRSMFTGGGPSGTVCQVCPNPRAQHYQFRMKMRAILRTAPNWVLSAVAPDPNSYFLPEDRLLLPEVGAIYTHATLLSEMDDPERIASSAIVAGHG